VGSRSKIKIFAYIAGFLDGDGSLMMQIKNRPDTKTGLRFMLTICFYQDHRHDETLYWIRKKLGIGYIFKRNDGITELRINGYKQIKKILNNLLPFIRIKKIQSKSILRASNLLSKKSWMNLTRSDKKRLLEYLLIVQKENYQSPKKKTEKELKIILGLTP